MISLPIINLENIVIRPIDFCILSENQSYVVLYELTHTQGETIITSRIPYYISDGQTNSLRINALLPFICVNELNIKENRGQETETEIYYDNELRRLINTQNIEHITQDANINARFELYYKRLQLLITIKNAVSTLNILIRQYKDIKRIIEQHTDNNIFDAELKLIYDNLQLHDKTYDEKIIAINNTLNTNINNIDTDHNTHKQLIVTRIGRLPDSVIQNEIVATRYYSYVEQSSHLIVDDKYKLVLRLIKQNMILLYQDTNNSNISESCPIVTDPERDFSSKGLLFKYVVCSNIDTESFQRSIFGEEGRERTGIKSFLGRITNLLDLVLCVSTHKLMTVNIYNTKDSLKRFIKLLGRNLSYVNYDASDDNTIITNLNQNQYFNLLKLLKQLGTNILQVCTITYENIPMSRFAEKLYSHDQYNLNFVRPNICNVSRNTSMINREAIANTNNYMTISNIFFALFKEKYEIVKGTIHLNQLQPLFKEGFACNVNDLPTIINNWGAMCLTGSKTNRKTTNDDGDVVDAKIARVEIKINGGNKQWFDKYMKYKKKYLELKSTYK